MDAKTVSSIPNFKKKWELKYDGLDIFLITVTFLAVTLHEDSKHKLVAIKESVFLLTIVICGGNSEEIA